MNRKKILIDGRIIGSGTGTYLVNLLSALSKIDQENNYTILVDQKELEYLKNCNLFGANFDFLSTRNSGRDQMYGIRGLLHCSFDIYKQKADLVHFPYQLKPVLYVKRNYIISILDLTELKALHSRGDNALKGWLQRIILFKLYFLGGHLSKKVLTDSNFVKRDIARKLLIRKSKIKTVYLAGNQNRNVEAKPISEFEEILKKKNTKMLLYVGNAQKHKNLDFMLRGFKMLSDENDNLILVLAGKIDESYRRLRELINDLGLRKKVILTDWISEAEKVWLYEKAEVYLFTSLSEGFGLPTIEAMQQGVPVVCSNATCLPEINGKAATYFDPRNLDEFIATVKSVLRDKSLQTDLIKRGGIQVNKYSWDATAKAILSEYKKLI